MPIEANSITPPSYMTGDPVPVADCRNVAPRELTDARVQAGPASVQYQVVFKMDPTKYANDIVWKATNASDMNTCVTEVRTILQEIVVPES